MRALPHRLVQAVFALFIMLVAAPAAAEDEQTRAKTLYNEGAEAYYKEEFSVAIMKFKTGYDLDPNAMFLYNIALAYGRLGNLDEALEYGRRADAEGLPVEAKPKNDARLRAWGVAESVQRVAGQLDVAQASSTSCDENAQCDGGQVCDLETSSCESAIAANSDESAISGLGWLGGGLAVAGVGLMTGALVVDMGLSEDIEAYDVANENGDTARAKALKDDIESAQGTGKILLYSGIGLTAAGAGLLLYDLLDNSKASESGLSIVPVLDPRAPGAAILLPF